MFCKHCGKEIPDGSAFCSYCGQSLNFEDGPKQEPAGGPPVDPSGSQSQNQEKEMMKYVAPYRCRNITIVMGGITVACLLAEPVIAFIYVVFTAFFLIPWLIGRMKMQRRMAHAKENGTYQQMVQEFSSSRPLVHGKVRYSEHFVFGKGCGWVLPYTEIVWVYLHRLSYVIIPILSRAMIGTQGGKVVPLCRIKLGAQAGKEEVTELANLIFQKNPDVLFGFSSENQMEYKKEQSEEKRKCFRGSHPSFLHW